MRDILKQMENFVSAVILRLQLFCDRVCEMLADHETLAESESASRFISSPRTAVVSGMQVNGTFCNRFYTIIVARVTSQQYGVMSANLHWFGIVHQWLLGSSID